MSLARIWDRRVTGWHAHVTSTSGFDKVRDRLLAISGPGPADACVDLGAGTGFVALALAPLAGSVHAVDISPVMAESLAARAAQAGLGNVRTEVADLKTFRLPAASVDLVVSSYALHHLRDEDKRALAALITSIPHGEGIAPEVRPRVIERGVRADEHVPGHGLGLAMVRETVALYGGRFFIDGSAALSGARVELQLPGR